MMGPDVTTMLDTGNPRGMTRATRRAARSAEGR